MATSTFYKNIYIDDAAADVMIDLLKKPAPPIGDVSDVFREHTKEDDKCFLRNRSARLLEQKSKTP